MTKELEDQKLSLEISELKSKIRWEPVKILGTFLGIFAILTGLGVERWAEANRRSFEVERAQHDRDVNSMTAISEDVGGLCARTHAVIRQHETKEVFEGAMIETLIDAAKELGEATPDPAKRKRIDLIRSEFERTKTAIVDELTEYGYWVRALELEAEWRRRQHTPRADFTRFFDQALLIEWQAVAAHADEGIGTAFSIFGDGITDLEGLSEGCLQFQSRLHSEIHQRTTIFCERHSKASDC